MKQYNNSEQACDRDARMREKATGVRSTVRAAVVASAARAPKASRRADAAAEEPGKFHELCFGALQYLFERSRYIYTYICIYIYIYIYTHIHI